MPVERPFDLDFNRLSDCQRVFKLDAKVSHRANHLRVPEEKLNSTQVACLLVNLSDLGSAYRMGALSTRFGPD